jgi:hypothetical protein
MQMKKILLMTVTVAGFMIANAAQAALGWTLAECKQHYGADGTTNGKDELGLDSYDFSAQGYKINVSIDETGKVITVSYMTPSFDDGAIDKILANNAPNVTWSAGSNQGMFSDKSKPSYRSADGYFAVLTHLSFFGTPVTKL